jgi:hypothetical protein
MIGTPELMKQIEPLTNQSTVWLAIVAPKGKLLVQVDKLLVGPTLVYREKGPDQFVALVPEARAQNLVGRLCTSGYMAAAHTSRAKAKAGLSELTRPTEARADLS